MTSRLNLMLEWILVIDNRSSVTNKVTEKELFVLELLFKVYGYKTSILAKKFSINIKTLSFRLK